MYTAAVLTVSDRSFRGERPDEAGPLVASLLEAAGYTPHVENGFAAKNVVAGGPETAKVLFSAHYDTCAVLPFPNFITPRNLFFYLCYQLMLVVPPVSCGGGGGGYPDRCHRGAEGAGASGADALYVHCPVRFFVWRLLDGPASRHTANDNTSGVLTLIETALALPPRERGRVCFVFFDNEEKGRVRLNGVYEGPQGGQKRDAEHQL